MKPLKMVFITIFGLLCFGLISCQSVGSQCQPTTVLFPTPNPLEPWLIEVAPNIKASQVCSLNGYITRGQKFKHQIAQNLVFCLLPRDSSIQQKNTGWHMVISDTEKGDCEDNFGPIVNPPYHFNALFDIYGRDFRNKDNTGENDGSVNAPQKMRQFNFLLNKADNDIATKTYQCVYWGLECPANGRSSVDIYDIFKIPRSIGTLTITDLKLGNLIPNDEAWIESMEFEVKIYLP